MSTIQQVYKKYKIMPSLALHQFRVAGVAMLLCQEIEGVEVDINAVVTACLLHDMGNIIKFKLDLFPAFLEPEGIEYWQGVKDEFIAKYGNDEHEATMAIAKEIFNTTDSRRVLELIDAIGFSNARINYESTDFGRKIAAYSDMRVEPHGVVSLEKRLSDGHRRFKIHKPKENREAFFQEMAEYLKKIEGQIFSHLSLDPNDITNERIASYIASLSQ